MILLSSEYFIAPSAAPTNVSVSAVTSSSITVQWEAVDCIHLNGDMAGYSVRYGVVGTGSTQTVSVSGGDATNATISSLMSSTTYFIEVAAVNSVGTGNYSHRVLQETIPSKVPFIRQLSCCMASLIHTCNFYPRTYMYMYMYVHVTVFICRFE